MKIITVIVKVRASAETLQTEFEREIEEARSQGVSLETYLSNDLRSFFVGSNPNNSTEVLQSEVTIRDDENN